MKPDFEKYDSLMAWFSTLSGIDCRGSRAVQNSSVLMRDQLLEGRIPDDNSVIQHPPYIAPSRDNYFIYNPPIITWGIDSEIVH